MKTLSFILSLFIFTGVCMSQQHHNKLTASEVNYIIESIDSISEKDQRHRSVISIGTFDQDIIVKDKAMRDTASIQTYLRFSKSIKRTITPEQKDSLWQLQHVLDYENYQQFKQIVKQYGYPSPDRLGKTTDQLYVILLHPPVELDVKEYQSEVMEMLKPEITAGRFDPYLLATFYDNMQCKILKEPQLYGTNKSFNPTTMKEGKPKIKNIITTNEARIEIGLPVLEEGDYEVQQ